MRTYLKHTKKLAVQTPPERNRVVDFWRAVAILMVVCGHWLAASIWLTPEGETKLLNSLEWVPYAAWITWLVQVMPIFFLAGGYANGRSLEKLESGTRRNWITARVRRLFTPVLPLLVIWAILILGLRHFVPAEVIHAGAMSATVPVWFLAVYLSLTALAPFTYSWWRRSGPRSIVILLAAAIAVDVVRFAFDVPGIGWVNFLFVWAAVHQLGYLWASRDDKGGVTSRTGRLVALGSLGLLIALTGTGLYPVAMVGIPGAELTNMTPPTFAIAVLGAMQLGTIWASQRTVRRFAATAAGWHAVVAVSGIIMTVYLWHLTAMSLVGAAGLFTFDGAVFRLEPGTTLWWATRPLWLAVLAVVTLGLVAVFARFEWRISRKPAPRRVPTVTVGLLLTAGSMAAVALEGIATREAAVQWAVLAAAFLGAATLGALPSRARRSGR